MTLAARNVSWRRGGALVVDDVSLRPAAGETIALLGPNGSGKSSLLRLLQGTSRPDSGVVSLDGTDLRDVRRRDAARVVAAVTQHADAKTDILVRDVVRLGRTPHGSIFSSDTAEDARAIDAALERTGLSHLAHRSWHTLSGGERQRAQIARALAQEPRELLLDEPTNHLDIRHQLELLELVAELPVTTIVALHDLNLASMFCDRVLVMRAGRAVAAGPPAEVLTPALIAEVYGVRANVVRDPRTGRASIVYLPGAPDTAPREAARPPAAPAAPVAATAG